MMVRVLVAIRMVMLVRMRMVMRVFVLIEMLLLQFLHIHHRLSIFCILQDFAPPRKPPRGMKFQTRLENWDPLRG